MKRVFALCIIIGMGFLVRMMGIHFGLPHVYHADEPIILNHAVGYGSFDFNPHFFKIPPLLSYLVFGCFGIYFCLGYGLGLFSSLSDFKILFLTDPTSFYLIARLLFGAFMGSATIYAVYRLSHRIWKDNMISMISACFIAFSFLHVENSHYVYCDIPMVLFVVLTMMAVVDLYLSGETRYYMWAGALGGVATGFKYNAAVIALSIFSAHFLRKTPLNLKSIFFGPSGRGKKLLLSAGVMIVTYLITNPFSVLDFNTFRDQLLSQAGAEHAFPVGFHLTYSLAEGIGWPMLFMAMLGGGWFFWTQAGRAAVVFSFPILFYILCLFVSQEHARYMLPVVPFCAMAAAFGLRQLASVGQLSARTSHLYGWAFLTLFPTAIKSGMIDFLFMKTDTRTEAKAWIENHVPAGARIAMDHTFFSPRLRHSEKQLEDKLGETDSPAQRERVQILMRESRERPAYELFYVVSGGKTNDTFLFSRPVIQDSWAALKEAGIQYVVVHRRKEKSAPFYDDLDHYGQVLQTFSPYRDPRKTYSEDTEVNTAAPFLSSEVYSRTRLGYTVQVYKL